MWFGTSSSDRGREAAAGGGRVVSPNSTLTCTLPATSREQHGDRGNHATIKMPAVRPRATAWSAVSPCLSSPRLLGGGASLAGNGLPSRFAGSIPERVVCQQRLWFPAPATSTPPFSENTFFAPAVPNSALSSKVRWGAERGRVPRE